MGVTSWRNASGDATLSFPGGEILWISESCLSVEGLIQSQSGLWLLGLGHGVSRKGPFHLCLAPLDSSRFACCSAGSWPGLSIEQRCAGSIRTFCVAIFHLKLCLLLFLFIWWLGRRLWLRRWCFLLVRIFPTFLRLEIVSMIRVTFPLGDLSCLYSWGSTGFQLYPEPGLTLNPFATAVRSAGVAPLNGAPRRAVCTSRIGSLRCSHLRLSMALWNCLVCILF